MIHLRQIPFLPQETEQVRKWLRLPAASLFRAHVSAIAAKHAADAGNKLSEGEEHGETEEAIEIAKQCATFWAFLKFLEEISDEEHKFFRVEMQPKPVNQPDEPK